MLRNDMELELKRTQHLAEEARRIRLNTRRLIIQAQYLAQKAKELHRAARAAYRGAQRVA